MKTNLSGLSKSVQLGRGAFLTSTNSSSVIVSTDGSTSNRGIIVADSADLNTLNLPSMKFGDSNISFNPLEGNQGISPLSSYVDMVNSYNEDLASSLTLNVSGLNALDVREVLIWTSGQGRVYLPVQASSWFDFIEKIVFQISQTSLDGVVSISLNGDIITVQSIDNSQILYQVLISKGLFGTLNGNEHTGQIENSLGQGFVNNNYVSNVILSIEDEPISYTVNGTDLTISLSGYYCAFANGRKTSVGKTSRINANGATIESGSGLKNIYAYCEDCEQIWRISDLTAFCDFDIWLVYDSSTETFSLRAYRSENYKYDITADAYSNSILYNRSTNTVSVFSTNWESVYMVRVARIRTNGSSNVLKFVPFYPFQVGTSDDIERLKYRTILQQTSVSGVVYLEAGQVYYITDSGNITFSPIVPQNTGVHNQIKIFLTLSTARTISLGSTHYIGGELPEVGEAGHYILYYDWFPGIGWCVGSMKVS